MIKTGLDIYEKKWPKELIGANIAFLNHPASVNRNIKQAVNLFSKSKKYQLKAIFGPQHGIQGETQDNMVEWKGFRDKKTGLPVYSLYGHTRSPEPAMLKDIDVIVVDLQDIGSRYYTYIWTVELCMRSCHEMGKSIVIFDRPNPIGGAIVEGPVLNEEFSSFVGLRPLPIRHGMTIGEISAYFKGEFYPTLDFHIVHMDGWNRAMWFNETGLPWVMPSPNMPTLDTAIVYPGTCLMEGTNISEGRGTTRPFEIFGAPFIDPDRLVKSLNEMKLTGAVFRPLHFQPTFQEYTGKLCGGVQIHVLNRESFKPFKTGVAIIKAICELYPGKFKWKKPPYEYEKKKMPIDILAGTNRLRKNIEKGESLDQMESWWKEDCMQFQRKVRRRFLIY